MSMGRRTDLVDEFGRIRWDDRVNLWAIVCSKPIDFVGNYYVEDMPMAYQQEGLNVRFSGLFLGRGKDSTNYVDRGILLSA